MKILSTRSSLFITTSQISQNSGGGNVSLHEFESLKRIYSDSNTILLSLNDIYPPKYNLPNNEFLYDYLADHLIENMHTISTNTNNTINNIDIVVTNGNPFGHTIKKLKDRNKDIIIIADCPAHNLEISIDEFKILKIQYPFVHMTDSFLWNLYASHIKQADIVLCPSRMSAEYISNKLDLQNDVVIIPYGCYTTESYITENYQYDDNFTFTYIGQNGPDKGLIYLINAWNMLESSIRDKSRLILAGQGTEHLGGLGYVNNITDIYNKCSVYIQPSVTESFGIPCLQAMAYGTPVIITKGAGVSELIEDGKEGFIVPIRDSKEIRNKIKYFLDNPSEIKRMGKNAKSLSKKYSWDIIEKSYEKLYLNYV